MTFRSWAEPLGGLAVELVQSHQSGGDEAPPSVGIGAHVEGSALSPPRCSPVGGTQTRAIAHERDQIDRRAGPVFPDRQLVVGL